MRVRVPNSRSICVRLIFFLLKFEYTSRDLPTYSGRCFVGGVRGGGVRGARYQKNILNRRAAGRSGPTSRGLVTFLRNRKWKVKYKVTSGKNACAEYEARIRSGEKKKKMLKLKHSTVFTSLLFFFFAMDVHGKTVISYNTHYNTCSQSTLSVRQLFTHCR